MKTKKLTPLENLSRWHHSGANEDRGKRVEQILDLTSSRPTAVTEWQLQELLVNARHAARNWWGPDAADRWRDLVHSVGARFERNCLGIPSGDPLQAVVVNIRDCPRGWEQRPEFCYIGRAMPRYGLKASPFGNPFKGDMALPAFRQKMLNDAQLRVQVRNVLSGRILVCWCKPNDCHGDVLAQIANGDPSWDLEAK